MNTTHVYVTVGAGSEKHNHDINYRNDLQHTNDSSHESVVELMPYVEYKKQVNDYFKPYIQEYNRKQDEKYKQDLTRWENGELKNKPKKSNKKYKHIPEDYYNERAEKEVYNRNKHVAKKQDLFDEVIVGFGDINQKDLLTPEQVLQVMKNTLEEVKKDFSNFLILGATAHLDEEGNYHMHIDYLPIYRKDPSEKHNGLAVGVNMDKSLAAMGYEKEQSFINKRNKTPIYFNAFRNRVDKAVEKELNKYEIYVERGVTADRFEQGHIDKDVWIQKKIKAHDIQELNNEVVDIQLQLEKETTKLNEVKKQTKELANFEGTQAATFLEEFFESVDNLKNQDPTQKGYFITFEFIEQLKLALKPFVKLREKVEEIIHEVSSLVNRITNVQKRSQELDRDTSGDSKVNTPKKQKDGLER